MNDQTWSYQTLEIKPGFMGNFAIDHLNDVLTAEGLKGWELVSTLNVGPMRPIILFMKKKR